jgi:EpsI family protein
MNMLSRVLAVGALLVLTGVFLHRHDQPERNPPREELTTFPYELGSWSGVDLPITQDVREILGPGDFLYRRYSSAGGSFIELFAAYFPSQRTGDTIHSPKNCLPGSGWIPVKAGHLTIPGPDHSQIIVNRYVVAKGEHQQLVLYWYQAHNRVTASEYWAKWYLISDSIRLNRSDGALVRVMSPRANHESMGAVEQRLVEFAGEITPLLNRYIPR